MGDCASRGRLCRSGFCEVWMGEGCACLPTGSLSSRKAGVVSGPSASECEWVRVGDYLGEGGCVTPHVNQSMLELGALVRMRKERGTIADPGCRAVWKEGAAPRRRFPAQPSPACSSARAHSQPPTHPPNRHTGGHPDKTQPDIRYIQRPPASETAAILGANCPGWTQSSAMSPSLPAR